MRALSSFLLVLIKLTSSFGGEVKIWISWLRVAKAVYNVNACRSIPPGVVPTGHFLVKTAILRGTGGGMWEEKLRWFQENSAERRSPEKEVEVVEAVLQMEAGGVWRRRRAGIVKRRTQKRVVARLDWIEQTGFLVLVTMVEVCGGGDGDGGIVLLMMFGLVFVVVNMVCVGI